MPELTRYSQHGPATNQTRAVKVATPTGEGVRSALQAVDEINSRIMQARAAREVAESETDATRRLDKEFRAMEADGEADYETFEERFTASAKEISESIRSGLKSSAARNIMDQRFKTLETSYLMRTRDLVRRRSIDDFGSGLESMAANLEQTAQDVDVPMHDGLNRSFSNERQNFEALLNTGIRQGFVDQTTAARYRVRTDALEKDAVARRHISSVETLLDANDHAAAREYLGENSEGLGAREREQIEDLIDKAQYDSYSLAISRGQLDRAGVEALEGQAGISDRYFESLLGKVEQKERIEEREKSQAFNEWQASNFAELQVGIDDGRYTRADADRMRDEGMIGPSQWSQAARQANDATSRLDDSLAFATALDSGLPIDATNTDMKKGADDLFNAQGGRSLFQEDFNTGLALTKRYAGVGIIPKTASSILRGYATNGTPEQQQQALTAIGDMHSAQPGAVNAAFSEREITDAISFTHKVNAGVPAETAYEALLVEREAKKNPSSGRAALISQARELTKEYTLGDALKRRDADGEKGFGPFWNDGEKVGSKSSPDDITDPFARAQILNDFNDAFEAQYALSGDEELAKRQAAAVIGRTVGVSEANSGRGMMHPPEFHYSIGGDDAWIRETLESMFSPRDGSFADIELISDVQTAQDIREGRPPSYAIVIHEQDGRTRTPLQARVDFVDERQAEIDRRSAEAEAEERGKFERERRISQMERDYRAKNMNMSSPVQQREQAKTEDRLRRLDERLGAE